jgi:hypothetical protein
MLSNGELNKMFELCLIKAKKYRQLPKKSQYAEKSNSVFLTIDEIKAHKLNN